jgi:lipid-A-disaccharide synthase
VLYYISPQVWAWRKGRTRKIARWVSRIAVVFPFEVPLYEKEGARVTFVGHPLLDLVRSSQSRDVTLNRYGLDPTKQTIVMLPGSRKREVDYLLPLMLQAAARLRTQREIQFVVLRASTVDRGQLENMLSMAPVPVAMAEMDTYNVLSASDMAWVASGTATLEAALLCKPMIVVYRLSWLTYALARLLVRVNHIGMVNIVAGDRVVPELIQNDVTEDRICTETQRILTDPNLCRQMVKRLEEVRERLGSPGAPRRVAEMALSLIN